MAPENRIRDGRAILIVKISLLLENSDDTKGVFRMEENGVGEGERAG